MTSLVPAAFWHLTYFDLRFTRHGFHALYREVRNRPVRQPDVRRRSVEQVCSAVDQAILWYPRQVLCLQRSTVAVWLLKESGFPAQLLLGAQQLPFRAHAWVEVEGQVVNDKPSVAEIYAVLERC
jgi:hypothetical protein